MRLAIIDIGTNTINLAIAVIKKESYQIIYSTKEPARLGKGGINDCMILPDAIERGVNAIGKHMETIRNFNVDKVVAIGTSIMRNASNGEEFAKLIEDKYDLDIKIVSGDDEAQLIYDGVKQVMPIGTDRVLILDIGGGSNEFILANKDGIVWKRSFELGLSRLLDKFKPSDPVTQPEIKQIEAYIRSELTPLYEALHNHPTSTLIGTSGSFDTIAGLIAGMKHPSMNVKLSTSYEITVPNFEELHRKLMVSTIEQRRAMPHMDKARIELIIPGSIFINFIVREMRIERITQCNYALKQGAVYQFINGQLE
jgi:exopolyphosphatase/guanosine-5'-triphosphate,3'-diphosphate pyrophosphatase